MFQTTYITADQEIKKKMKISLDVKQENLVLREATKLNLLKHNLQKLRVFIMKDNELPPIAEPEPPIGLFVCFPCIVEEVTTHAC